MTLQTLNRPSLRCRLWLLLLLVFCQLPILHAEEIKQQSTQPAPESSMAIFMIIIMLILLLAIALMSHVLKGAMEIYREKLMKEKAGTATTLLIIIFLFNSSTVFAQSPAVTETGVINMGGLSPLVFYLIWAVIGLELLVLFALIINLKIIMGFGKKSKRIAATTVISRPAVKSLWEKLNSFKPVEHEAEIELAHSYDGIRELDNKLPPWWLYGFYATILFSVVYLWRFHVSHTAPSQEEEFVAAMQMADAQKQAFLKKAANQVDEGTVKYMDAAADLNTGKALFEINCTACHGKAGEGVVGPNLTDAYWLHGGSINDVFKSIKYGIPEKGMRNWNEDFSPVQLAQLASYVKSIGGTNPPNAKEQQGELFEDAQPVSSQQNETGLTSETK